MSIIELKTVCSTNDHAKDIARQGAAAGTVVWAREQTAGRGRLGNEWVSAPGNLYMSIILYPKTPAAHVGQLSFLSAVALAAVLEKIIPPAAQVQLKWPNDVLINCKKAAGILIETESGAPWVVVGMGLNVANAPTGALCLHDIGVKTHTAGDILSLLVDEMRERLAAWEKSGFKSVRTAWLKRAYNLGQEIRARLPKETLTGVFEGIDEQGSLQLKMKDGKIKTMNSGEVFI